VQNPPPNTPNPAFQHHTNTNTNTNTKTNTQTTNQHTASSADDIVAVVEASLPHGAALAVFDAVRRQLTALVPCPFAFGACHMTVPPRLFPFRGLQG
jgi:hypothetical protein